jgi:hypothetical protein
LPAMNERTAYDRCHVVRQVPRCTTGATLYDRCHVVRQVPRCTPGATLYDRCHVVRQVHIVRRAPPVRPRRCRIARLRAFILATADCPADPKAPPGGQSTATAPLDRGRQHHAPNATHWLKLQATLYLSQRPSSGLSHEPILVIWPYVRSARRAASHLLPFHSHGDRSVPPSDLVHGIPGRLGRVGNGRRYGSAKVGGCQGGGDGMDHSRVIVATHDTTVVLLVQVVPVHRT